MNYAIWATDVANSLEQRKQARPDHIQRLAELQNQGRLILAGPCPAVDAADMPEHGYSGSLIVAEFSSLEKAQQWANEDPYLKVGVYDHVEIRPYLQVFPK